MKIIIDRLDFSLLVNFVLNASEMTDGYCTDLNVVPRIGWERQVSRSRQAGVGRPVGSEAFSLSEQVCMEAHQQPIAFRLDGSRHLCPTKRAYNGSQRHVFYHSDQTEGFLAVRPFELTVFLIEPTGQGTDVVHHDVIEALGREEVFGFEVKVSKRQCDFFPKRHCDVPHALGIGLVIHRPVRRLYDSSLLLGRHPTALDF